MVEEKPRINENEGATPSFLLFTLFLKAQKLASTEWKWKKNLHPDKNDSWYLDGNA
jgi:hypothetical protein